MRFRQESPPFTFQSSSRPKATGKTPLRQFYRKTRQYYSQFDLKHRFMPLPRLPLETCGGCPGQIWPLGDIFRVKGTLGYQDRTGDQRSLFQNTKKYAGFHRVSRLNSPFPASPGIPRGYYAPCESPMAFQYYDVENETLPNRWFFKTTDLYPLLMHKCRNLL